MADPISNFTPIVGAAQNLVGRILGFTQATPAATNDSSISVFNSIVNKRGLARTNRSFVYMTIPRSVVIRGGFQHVEKEIMLMCETAALPGVSLAMSDGRRYGLGPVDRRPFAPVFTDLNLNFYGDQTNLIHRFFYTWLNSIVRFDSKSHAMRDNLESNDAFRAQYRDEYTTDISILSYDENHNVYSKVTLNKCFPYQIGDVPLSWADSDQIVRFPITFHFWNWKLDETPVDSILKTGKMAPELNILERVYKTYTAYQALKSLKKPQSIGDILNVTNNARIVLENY